MSEMQARVPEGVPAGGQYAASPRPDAEVSLGAGDPDHDAVFEAREIVERLIGREVVSGGFTEIDRVDDVEDEMRERCPHLSEQEFLDRFDGLANLAERISVLERAEEDAEEVEVEAAEYRIERDDFLTDDGYDIDLGAYKAAVVAELDADLMGRVHALVAADFADAAAAPPGLRAV